MTLCLTHRIVGPTSRTEAVARFRKRWIDPWLQDLQQGLLDQPIRHRRDPQLPHPATRFRNLHAAHRLWPVAPRVQFLPNTWPVRLQEPLRLRNRQPIHPRTAAIGLDAFPRRDHVRARERLPQQIRSPQASASIPRQPCFIACTARQGFTSPLGTSPRSPGRLMPCTSTRHAPRLSSSFGPSRYRYYGLC